MGRSTWFCIDIEASGPVPSLFDMISLGAVAVHENEDGTLRIGDSFYVEIVPTAPGWDEEAEAHFADRTESPLAVDRSGVHSIKGLQLELDRAAFKAGDVLPVKALLGVLAPAEVSDAQIDEYVAAYETPADDGGDEDAALLCPGLLPGRSLRQPRLCVAVVRVVGYGVAL